MTELAASSRLFTPNGLSEEFPILVLGHWAGAGVHGTIDSVGTQVF